MKKIICIIMILTVTVFSLSGCLMISEETETFEISITTKDLIKTAPLVFLGRVKSEGQGWYRNADEVHFYADGRPMFNYWITPYTVEILEVYKGDLAENITELTLGTYNHHSPEDKPNEKGFYLKASDTAIFCARFEEVDGCYKPIYAQKGVFFPDKTRKAYVSENNVIDITDIENILKKAADSGIDYAAMAGEATDIKAEHKKQTVK